MRSILFIFLGSIFLNCATELHQLFKLPFLLAHYHHHRGEDKSLTLYAFFKLHYSGDHPTDNDDTEDTELPFKSVGQINHLDTPPARIKDSMEEPVAQVAHTKQFIHPEGKPFPISF